MSDEECHCLSHRIRLDCSLIWHQGCLTGEYFGRGLFIVGGEMVNDHIHGLL